MGGVRAPILKPHDWNLGAKIAARDNSDKFQKILLFGAHGMYTVHLYIVVMMEKIGSLVTAGGNQMAKL